MARRREAVSVLRTASKLSKPLVKGIAAINIAATVTSVADDVDHGRMKSATARNSVFIIGMGAALIPVVGWGVALGIGIADAMWGDQFYEYVENNW